MPEIHSFAQFIIFFVEIILKVALDEDSFWHGLIAGLRSHDLFDFVVNGVFLDFTEPEIRWINRPVIGSLFLLSRIIIFVRFEIHSSDLLCFWHVLS